MRKDLLAADFAEKMNSCPGNKVPLPAERMQQIFRTGRAYGYEWRMIIAFLGIYIFQFEERYNKVINDHKTLINQ